MRRVDPLYDDDVAKSTTFCLVGQPTNCQGKKHFLRYAHEARGNRRVDARSVEHTFRYDEVGHTRTGLVNIQAFKGRGERSCRRRSDHHRFGHSSAWKHTNYVVSDDNVAAAMWLGRGKCRARSFGISLPSHVDVSFLDVNTNIFLFQGPRTLASSYEALPARLTTNLTTDSDDSLYSVRYTLVFGPLSWFYVNLAYSRSKTSSRHMTIIGTNMFGVMSFDA